MEGNTKKRCRKTKLVPREYLDSDDENIAQMQNEIEETIAKMNPHSILRKLEPKKSNSNSLEFSVKVEVEEFNETDELEVKNTEEYEEIAVQEVNTAVQEVNTAVKEEIAESVHIVPHNDTVNEEGSKDLNIKIQSITSLNESHSPNTTIQIYYKIDEDAIREEFDMLSEKTTNKADKLIEIHMRNNFGRKQAYIAESNFDKTLQTKLKKWRSWYDACPDLRDAPIMYICYSCDKAWWHFSEFREHAVNHNFIHYHMETHGHDFRFTIVQGKKFERKIIPIDSNCWRCSKNSNVHLKTEYTCNGCNKILTSCTLLSIHEGECEAYKEIFRKSGIDTSKTYSCPVCPYKHWEQNQIQRHLIARHSVRSDLPSHWTTKYCPKCSLSYQDSRVHECLHRHMTEICDYCSKKFQARAALSLHLNNCKPNVPCRICGERLKMDCMEMEHLLQHSDNYIMLYKCSHCTEPIYFLNFDSIDDHKLSKHKYSMKLFYDKVIIPKRLLEKLQPFKTKLKLTKKCKLTPNSPPMSFDNACQGLIGYLDTKKVVQQYVLKPNDAEVPNNYFDAELGVQVTVIDKNAVQKLFNDANDERVDEIRKMFTTTLNNQDQETKKLEHKTYTNKRKSKNEIQIEIPQTLPGIEIKQELQNEVELQNDNVEIKQELMDTDVNSDEANIEVKKEIEVPGIQNETESYELEIKEEVFEDERDLIILDNANYMEADESNNSFRFQSNDDEENYIKEPRKRQKRQLTLPLKAMADRYKCTKCDKTLKTMRKYLYHFRHHNYNPTSCPKCFKQFAFHQNLLVHVNMHIKNNFVMMHAIQDRQVETKSNYQCRKCKKSLCLKDFFQHWESHLEIKDVATVEERYVVNMDAKPQVKEMLKILQGPDSSDPATEDWKLRMCIKCNKRFERRNDCKRHYIEHLLTDAYSERHKHGYLMCQICGCGFPKRDDYKRHMRDHASLPIYKCEICDKTFSDSSNFCKHKKVHNLAVLICDICKKKFNNKEYLVKHIQMHQVIKPINCKTCEKVFYTQSSYNKHLKKNGSRFKCPVCTIYYPSLKEKWDHMWQVHKERKYEADCPICNKSFRKFLDVKRHLRDQHKESQYNFTYYKTRTKPSKKIKRESDEDVDVI